MFNSFNPVEAKNLLLKDRRAYLEKLKKYLEYYLSQDGKGNISQEAWEDMAAESVIAAAQELCRVDGSMQYLVELSKSNEYPRFGTILGD